jgi:hypothetical protein
MSENQTALFLALLLACLNQLRTIDEQLSLIALQIETNLEMSRSLLQQRYLSSSTFFFAIPSLLEALPFLLAVNENPRNEGNTFSNYHYWTVSHPFLTDDDNPRTSYRAMYRMNRTTFERIVNDLSNHSEFALTAANALPSYIQISCAISRLANWHIGYRNANVGWGVSHGTYMNATRRFVKAVKETYRNVIHWPVDREKVQEIQQGFQHPLGEFGPHRLPGVIGALDGKNVVIKAPSPPSYAEYWRDRKGKFSVKLTAVCDHMCRFTYISVGDSGYYSTVHNCNWLV